MYARGILFGKMKYELGDHSFIKCPENGLMADIDFKTKGYFGGTYNAITGNIKNEKTGETLFELSGMWSGEMVLKDVRTGHKEVLFNAAHARHTPPIVRPIEEQDERESQRLWLKTVKAIKESNHIAATEEKSKIEDRQRDETAKRAEQGIEWQPKLFRPVRGGPGGPEEGEEDLDWILNANIDGITSEEKTKQIIAVAPILKGQHHNQQSKAAQVHQSQETSQPPSRSQEQTAGHDDLIDFGQSNPAPLTSAPIGQTDPMHFQPDAPQGMQAPLQPGHPIKRVDTKTNDLDEFVDAPDI
ncbi:hypothetical protein IMSHALPRED_008651 [Imshaugia aleurites]|uniref:Oxysterol-binding protein n=1 Tax=Imshaugia aleurites TaxID=172621 RepID=A0A8H3IXV2_9LECA|nr:hypothetical protein IMSHALPRED_008651 [Imshaugia aleurites]